MEKTNDKRIIFIDIARGLSILLMILGHIIPHGILRNFIFSFHMPLFIIISGYFFKDMSFKKTVKKLTTKFLIPTALVLFVTLLIKNIFTLGIYNSILSSLKSVLFGYSFSSKIIYNFNKTSKNIIKNNKISTTKLTLTII